MFLRSLKSLPTDVSELEMQLAAARHLADQLYRENNDLRSLVQQLSAELDARDRAAFQVSRLLPPGS